MKVILALMLFCFVFIACSDKTTTPTEPTTHESAIAKLYDKVLVMDYLNVDGINARIFDAKKYDDYQKNYRAVFMKNGTGRVYGQIVQNEANWLLSTDGTRIFFSYNGMSIPAKLISLTEDRITIRWEHERFGKLREFELSAIVW